MRVVAEVLSTRRETAIELPAGSTGMELLAALGLAPDAHLLVREDSPIPWDDVLRDGERLTIIAVASGGSSA